MVKLIEIYCENNQVKKEYPLGTNLFDIIKDQNITLDNPILGAKVNNKLEELTYSIFKPKSVRFIDATDVDGYRMYLRSISFILIKAVKDIYPNYRVKIEHSISKGFYCELEGMEEKLTMDHVFNIVTQMRLIVSEDLPFYRQEVLTQEAIKIYEQNNLYEKVQLFKSRPTLYTSVYSLGSQVDYFYGFLVPSTGYLKVFDLVKYYKGMLLLLPKRSNPNEIEELVRQDKLFDIFREYKKWGKILDIDTIGSINQKVKSDKGSELIKIAEALHEKKVAKIADMIRSGQKEIRLVLISGPSSSGKTTFSKRLSIQLKVNRLKPIELSLDNYFVDRISTPVDENGEYNFEALEAIDVKLFNRHILDLLDGKEVKIPKFDFESGKRINGGQSLKLKGKNIIIIEGIHALNPQLTPMIDRKKKFFIYVSALTQVGIDGHNRIPTTDNRLVRRLIRDYRYRGYSALDTLKRWESVKRGEEEYIFPFQEEADVMFNSALPFELGVLKSHAEPLLKEVPPTEPEHAEALRLLKFLSYFTPIPENEIPPTSILREFLGGSSFSYK